MQRRLKGPRELSNEIGKYSRKCCFRGIFKIFFDCFEIWFSSELLCVSNSIFLSLLHALRRKLPKSFFEKFNFLLKHDQNCQAYPEIGELHAMSSLLNIFKFWTDLFPALGPRKILSSWSHYFEFYCEFRRLGSMNLI